MLVAVEVNKFHSSPQFEVSLLSSLSTLEPPAWLPSSLKRRISVSLHRRIVSLFTTFILVRFTTKQHCKLPQIASHSCFLLQCALFIFQRAIRFWAWRTDSLWEEHFDKRIWCFQLETHHVIYQCLLNLGAVDTSLGFIFFKTTTSINMHTGSKASKAQSS